MGVNLLSPLRPVLGNDEPLIELHGNALTFEYYGVILLRNVKQILTTTILKNRARLPVRPGGLCRRRLDGTLSDSN